ncbi:hypothetical protein FEK30_15085 [Picosynechococcus sp. PCC 11901]|uniref:hypothetical protein n=1 Tax=Picosynechococcus sp. PCC 11901 TaxID=2579791 RepID=UPI0010FBFCB5|nr:hypothetical protein [Picosynechococcus sp. PCC 11901]QCS50643.1 hypothetical protein FEK30_15085 [Picosynechococcus sp. PCC 11901]
MFKLGTISQFFSLLYLGLMPGVIAAPPDASQIVSLTGDRLMMQQGSHRQQAAQVGDRLENHSQSLIVPGNNHSFARLVLVGDRQTYDGLLLQTGPAPQQTQYRFPCVVEGGTITLSWQKGQQRGCAEGLRIRPNPEGRSPTQRLKIFAYQMVLSPAAASAIPTDSELVIQPSGETPICVRVTTQDKRQIVEVLWGEIILSSANHPQGLKIRKGTQYDQGELQFFDPDTRLASPAMQAFFSAAAWSNAATSTPLSGEIQNHIDVIRTAFATAQ